MMSPIAMCNAHISMNVTLPRKKKMKNGRMNDFKCHLITLLEIYKISKKNSVSHDDYVFSCGACEALSKLLRKIDRYEEDEPA